MDLAVTRISIFAPTGKAIAVVSSCARITLRLSFIRNVTLTISIASACVAEEIVA
jgi:hypothetical protein